MSEAFASVEPDGPLYRLGRHPDPWAWPDWAYAGPDGTFGNRYDDPEASYRVLYASSQRVGTFLETLARFRPDLEVLAELEEIDELPRRRSSYIATIPWSAMRCCGGGCTMNYNAISAQRIAGALGAPKSLASISHGHSPTRSLTRSARHCSTIRSSSFTTSI